MLFSNIINIKNIILPTRKTTQPDTQINHHEVICQPSIGITLSQRVHGSAVAEGIKFLGKKISGTTGAQSKIGSSRKLDDAKPCPFEEIYTSAVISDILRDTSIDPEITLSLNKFIKKSYDYKTGYFNFFTQKEIIPDEVDTTSIAILALYERDNTISKNDIKNTINKIVKNINGEGIIQTYFPPRGKRENRIDPVVCASAMRLIYKFGKSAEAKATEKYMYDVLEAGSYFENIYFTPDSFLYYLYKAVINSPPALEKFRPLLIKNIKSQLNTTQYPIDLSMRIIVCEGLGLLEDKQVRLQVTQEKKTLESLQSKTRGSWPRDAIYKASRGMNGKEIHFGSTALSTAFAVSALHQLSQSPYFKTENKPTNFGEMA